MADPFSIVVGAIGALDVIVRLSLSISKIVNASAETKRLSQLIADLKSVLIQIKQIDSSYTWATLGSHVQDAVLKMRDVLKHCGEDLHSLERLLAAPNSSARMSLNRFGKKVKSIFDEQKINNHSLNVERHKNTLTMLLSVIGRKIDIHLVSNLADVQEKVQDLTQNIASLEHTVLSHASSAQGSLSALQSRQDLAASNIREGISQVLTAQRNVRRLQHQQRQDLSLNASIITAGQRHMQKQLDRIVDNLKCLQASGLQDESAVRTIIFGCAIDSATALAHIASSMKRIYAVASAYLGSNNTARADNDTWLQEQFEELIADSQYASSTELRRRRRRKGSGITMGVGESAYLQNSLTTSSLREARHNSYSASRKRKASSDHGEVEIPTPFGKVALRFTMERKSEQIITIHMLFTPTMNRMIELKGISITFIRSTNPGHLMSRTLTTFAVLSWESSVFSMIADGNTNGIRDLLSTGQIHPNDRDFKGDSLLLLALWYGKYDICQLLLQEGANPFDCDRYGRCVLSCFLLSLQPRILGPSGGLDVTSQGISSIDIEFGCRLFLSHCGTEEGVIAIYWDEYGREIGKAITPLYHLTWPILPDHEAELFLFQPMRHIFRQVHSLEERDLFGRTTLLASINVVRRSQLPEVIKILLQSGANPLAVDPNGSGILHRILRAISACNNQILTKDFFQSMKKLICQLLEAGCNPSLLTRWGHTPSDYALIPTAWVLWCDALHATGLELPKILQKDDELQNVVFGQGYLEAKYQRIVNTARPSWSEEAQPDRNLVQYLSRCVYCDTSGHWSRCLPPFDTIGSYKVSVGDYISHAYLENHHDGTFCANAISWGSCQNLCHVRDGETYWPSKAKSWRKHVAYRLWKEGILGTPEKSYFWATGLSPECNQLGK